MSDVENVAAGLDLDPGAVEYRLRPTGPTLYPRLTSYCWWCQDPRHGEAGSSCPVVYLSSAELLRPDLPAWLRRERGANLPKTCPSSAREPRAGVLTPRREPAGPGTGPATGRPVRGDRAPTPAAAGRPDTATPAAATSSRRPTNESENRT